MKSLDKKTTFKLSVFASLLLSGCVTTGYTSEKEVCEVKPTWVEYAQCLNVIGSKYYGDDLTERRMIAYRNLLIERVQRKQITEAEAEYMRQEKWSQAKRETNMPNYYTPPSGASAARSSSNSLLLEAIKNNQQQRTTMDLELKSLTTTDCQPNGYGGIRCVTD